MERLTLVLSISLIASLFLLVFLRIKYYDGRKTTRPSQHQQQGLSCSGTHTCGAQDPVSEPEYNMKEVIKQSILLEEHLTIASKRCKDCIAKHFLHIHGLVSEAIMLACDRVDQYPMMKECNQDYEQLFKEWLDDKENDEGLRRIAGKLREVRKKLVAVYVLETTSVTDSQSVHDSHEA